MNKAIILGHVGAEPTKRATPSGSVVCNFNVATTERWTDKNGEKQERTEWHRVVCWEKLADIAGAYCVKGKQVLIEGRLQTRSWEKQDGSKAYTTEIIASNLELLGRADNPRESGDVCKTPDTGSSTHDDMFGEPGAPEDDLPF